MQQLSKKLQLKQGQYLLLLNAPASAAELFSADGIVVKKEQDKRNRFDAVQLFVHNKAELNSFAQEAIENLRPNGMLWIAYPKKSSGMESDLTRDEGWKVMSENGYEGVRQIAIDDVWSSLRFRHKSERKEPSKMGVDYPGIDKVNRVVTPPADLQQALDEAGLTEKFLAMTFTSKKEYVLAVLEAKREETRVNRILKTIEQVAEK